MGAGKEAETLLHTSMKRLCLRIEARLLSTHTIVIKSSIGSHMHLCRVEVKQNREVRHAPPCSQQRELLHQLHADAACKTLVGNTGIEAAIGNDKPACLKRGQYHCSKMLCAVGLEKQCLCQRSDRQFWTIQQQLAYLNAKRRSPRLACPQIRHLLHIQPAPQQFNLRRLASTIQSLKRNQTSCVHNPPPPSVR